MANNLIQIRRSNTAASPSPTSNLVSGELAFSYNSNSLFIGAQSGATGTSYKIGGAKYNYVDQAGSPGVQTANAVVILDANSFTTNTYTQGLVIQTSGAVSTPAITAINAVANLTNLGAASNSELTTTWAIKTFVDAKVASASNPQGSNGQFQYNDSGVLAGTTNMTYDKVNTLVTIGNSTINVTFGSVAAANQIAKFAGNQNTYLQVIHQNANTGNNASADYVLFNDVGVTGNGEVNLLDLGYNSSTYNDPAYNVTDAGGGYLYTANGSLAIGTKDSATGAVLKFFTGGTTASNERVRIDNSGNVGIGNTAPNAKLQVTGTANISGLTTIGANLVLGAALSANGSTGTSGWVLKSGGTGNVYWEATTATVAGSDTQVQYNNGGVLAGAAGLTFTNSTNNISMANNLAVTNTVSIGNSTINTIANSSLIKIANATNSANLSITALTISNTAVNTIAFSITGNSTTVPTMTLNTSALSIGNNSSTGAPQAIFANATATTTVNAGVISIGANVVVNTSVAALGTGSTTNAPQVIVANTTATTTVNAGAVSIGANVVVDTAKASFGTGSTTNAPQVIVANTIGTTTVNSNIITVGSNSVINLSAHAVLGNSTTAPTSILTGAALNIGNTTITGAPQVVVANAAATTTVNAGTISVGANVVVDTAKASFGTGSTTNAPQVIVANTIGTATINSNIITVGGNSVINLTAHAILGNTTTAPTSVLTGSALNIGNTTITGAPTIVLANTVGTTTVNTNIITVGSNSIMNVTAHAILGNSTTAPTSVLTGAALNIGNNSITGAPQVVVANATATTTVNAGTISVGANVVVDTAKVSLGTGSTTNAPQVIVANTSGTTTVNANIITVGANTLMNLTAFSITGNTTTAPTTTLSGTGLVSGNTSITGAPQIIIANTTGNVIVNTTSIALSNSTATPVLANTSGVYTTGVANAATLSVGTAFIANTTKVTFTGANVDATSAAIAARDLTLSGNLTVQGTLTTVDTTNLQVKDSMIKLADQNTTTDTLDIGFYGAYGNSTATYFSGLYRDRGGSTMTSPLFKLFTSNTEPSGIVDNTALGYVLGTLNAYLTTGALIANSTVVNITANSTVSVALTANSLSLSTALPATSGGTGQNTYTSGDLLVANTGNALSKLALSSTAGYVLQSNGTALVYNTLDGGTF